MPPFQLEWHAYKLKIKTGYKDPPFYIPEFELKMAWCPLLHHHPAHRWLRQLILFVARQMIEEENREFLTNNSQFSHY